MTDALPEYELPPVTEIVIAVQFVPVMQFGMREAVAVSRAFAGWEIVEVPPALEPIVESPLGAPEVPALRLGLGSLPLRLIMSSDGRRWLAQVQQDRLAIHERRVDSPPTFPRVAERLGEVRAAASDGIGVALLQSPYQPELVEVIYDNTIRLGGGWRDLADLHRVLRIVSADSGEEPFDRPEQVQVGMTYLLRDGQQFAGRLRVTAGPRLVAGEQPAIGLQLVSRRLVGDRDLDSVLKHSHADLVRAFTAVTTDSMHEQWSRVR